MNDSNFRRVAFLDRDGVINVDYSYVSSVKEFSFIPGVFDACRMLQNAGYLIIIITNQSGIGRGYYDVSKFLSLSNWMKFKFHQQGIRIADIFFCPHHPTDALSAYRKTCFCRKPNPGMFLAAKAKWNIDMANSLMIGDKRSDMIAASRAGVGTRILVGTDATFVPEMVPECTAVAKDLLSAVDLLPTKI